MKTISQRIALNLKSLRQKLDWSLDKTAEVTGVSKAMLGQIEREESSPTVATLWKIATGFNIPFSSLLESNATKISKQTQKVERLDSKHEKILVTPLFPFDKALQCEIFLIELQPQCEHLSPGHKAGIIEHVIVTEGTVEVLIKGKWHTLAKSEGIRFNAAKPHGYRNNMNKKAYIHNIIHYQNKYL